MKQYQIISIKFSVHVTIDDVVFNMDHQSVIDAFNKCPDHSGLDFTFSDDISKYIEINPDNALFDVDKELKHKEIKAEQFEFELYYVSGPNKTTSSSDDHILLGTVKNNEDGKVYFDNQFYDAPGIYTYKIKEVKGTDESIIYDDGYVEVKVEVTESRETEKDPTTFNTIQKISYNAEILSYTKYKANGSIDEKATSVKTFSNICIYELPSAGGPGVYIFTISGAGFILAAAVMYRRKRKEECVYK